jgi:hypothetical protein
VDTITGDYPAGDLRVSDADRDRAISELSEHFQAGRLTADEHDERMGRAMQARTGRELAALFADLPRRQAPATELSPRPHGRAPGVLIGVGASLIAVLVARVVLVSSQPALYHYRGFAGPGPHAIPLLPVLVVLVVVGFLVRRHQRGGRWYR